MCHAHFSDLVVCARAYRQALARQLRRVVVRPILNRFGSGLKHSTQGRTGSTLGYFAKLWPTFAEVIIPSTHDLRKGSHSFTACAKPTFWTWPFRQVACAEHCRYSMTTGPILFGFEAKGSGGGRLYFGPLR
jgi:hypothetical protein